MDFSDVDPLDWKTVQPHVDALLAAELDPNSVQAWLEHWSELWAILTESRAATERAVAENTADRAAEERFLLLVEQIMPQTQLAEQALRDKLLACSVCLPSAGQELMLKRFRAEAGLFRPENVPLDSELRKLANQYDKINGAMTIEWEGRTETLPEAGLHLRERDREVRARAWRLILDRNLAERERLNGLYLQMLELRRRAARNAGLPDYRAYQWQALHRFDYTPEDCFTFHDAIEHEVVPVARQIYAELAGRLGLETLRPWDTEVDPYGEPLRPFTQVADLEEGTYRIFEQVDPALAAHFQVMREGFLDLPSRPNKAPGGYCESFPVSRRPYIFMNAVGSHEDVQTLLHEGGHAFHFMESLRQPLLWNQNGPTEFCEVASMGMELLAAPYLAKSRGGFYPERDARRAVVEHLRGIVRFLPYMAVVDAFQHWVYVDAPENVAAVDLDARWSELWDRFMQGIDYTGLQTEKETGWHRKLHIFTNPFYYVEYGLAQLGALQIWRNALADQAAAVSKYRNALALGYTQSLPQLFVAAGARFAFDRQTVGELMSLVMRQLEQLAV